jgi:hypothetical protein
MAGLCPKSALIDNSALGPGCGGTIAGIAVTGENNNIQARLGSDISRRAACDSSPNDKEIGFQSAAESTSHPSTCPGQSESGRQISATFHAFPHAPFQHWLYGIKTSAAPARAATESFSIPQVTRGYAASRGASMAKLEAWRGHLNRFGGLVLQLVPAT